MIREDNNTDKIRELTDLEKERRKLEKELEDKIGTDDLINPYRKSIEDFKKDIADSFTMVFKEDDLFEMYYHLTKGHLITAIDTYKRGLKKLNITNESLSLVSIFKQILLELFHK